MPNPLKRFIERQLKGNVPLSEIKKDLQEKGYGIDVINKAVRETIAGLNKKTLPLPTIQIIVLAIGVVIALGVGIYLSYKPGIAISPQLPANSQETIQNFVKESLKENYLPKALTFREINRSVPENITYTANWNIANTPLSVSYNSKDKIEFLTIAASVPAINGSLNPSLASSLANRFFKDFQENWKCAEVADYSFCESMRVEENGDKKSVFIFGPVGKLRPKTLVVSCLIPVGSDFYEMDSCIVRDQE